MTYKSPFEVHREQAAHFIQMRKPVTPGPNPTGKEIACVVGGINEEPIQALYHPASRTVYPVRETK